MPVSHSSPTRALNLSWKTCISWDLNLIWSLVIPIRLVFCFTKVFAAIESLWLSQLLLIGYHFFSTFCYFSRVTTEFNKINTSHLISLYLYFLFTLCFSNTSYVVTTNLFFHLKLQLVKFNNLTIGLPFISGTDTMIGQMIGSHYQPGCKRSNPKICLSAYIPRPLIIPDVSVCIS